MTKPDDDQPNLSSTAFFVGASVILILVAVIITMGGSLKTTNIQFGSCKLKTEVAATNEQKARGLSNRPGIDKNEAMVFPFNRELPSFWMKDMLFPIDIVWVAGKKVVKIDAQVPADDGATNYTPPVPIDWVIEVGSGLSKDCDVKEGTEIEGLRS